ncbi:MAG: hypothetical protein KF895_06805 [Parvibaculum sp.]|nr:hypothetical protein [Parvibaculum sp.]
MTEQDNAAHPKIAYPKNEEEFANLTGAHFFDIALFGLMSRVLTPREMPTYPVYTIWTWIAIGLFQTLWMNVETLTDFAIGKFLKVSHEQAHLVTAGLMFGRKARLLADLVARSDHPRRSELLGIVNKIRGQTKRDVLFHSTIGASEDGTKLVFTHRDAGQSLRVVEYSFTKKEFINHLQLLMNLTMDLQSELPASQEEMDGFRRAAFNASRKAKPSPE